MKTMLAALLMLGLAGSAWAGGYSPALPFHTPPRLRPEKGQTAFQLSAGWWEARAAGLSGGGPGGGWELAARRDELGGALHGQGFVFAGSMDPSGAGRLKAGGFTGTVEGDLVWAPGGASSPWRLYLGGLVSLTALNFASARTVSLPVGARAEPDGAYSLVFGLPAGAELGGSLGGDWLGTAGVFAAPYLGGSTFYTYTLPGAKLHGSSRHDDAHVAAGARLRVEQTAWRLSLEAGGSAASRSGNSRGLSAFWALLGFRAF